MVSKIITGSNLYGALAYNQQKVDEGLGKVLATHNIMEPADGNFVVSHVAQDMLEGLPARIRTEKPVIHISINPDPKDKLSDQQLTEIASEYMERMGWGGQPHIVFKHSDIDRTHIHIVALQVKKDGKKINDSKRNERSWEITQDLERKYGLYRAKEQKRADLWKLAPVDPAKGEVKRQMAAVIKPALSMYRFQTMGEFKALLSLYNIGIEEVRGERDGQAYRGLLYTALNAGGGKAETTPLKSSLFGKPYGFEALERHMERSAGKIAKDNSREHTRHRVVEAFLDAPTESELRERLRAYHIDLFIRRNDMGRITGVTFIDHEARCVMNGSRLGKEFSANAVNDLFRESPVNGGHTKQEGGKEQISHGGEPFVPEEPAKKAKLPKTKPPKGHKLS